MRQWQRSVWGGLAAALLCSCVEAPLEPREPSPSAVALRVASFNVNVGRLHDQRTMDSLRSLEVDVLCLQEVDAAYAERLRRELQPTYPFLWIAPQDNAGGLAVLSRWPAWPKLRAVAPTGVHPSWLFEIDVQGARMQLLAVHLRSLFNGSSNPVNNFFRTGDAHEAELRWFYEHRDPQLPLVVAGDFNEGPKGQAVRWLEQQGFLNALPAFRPGQFTWSSAGVGDTVDLAIDHVLVSPELELLDAQIGDRGGSDHYPVWARFELPAPASP